MTTNKKTPLYDRHKELGAKVIPFGGWEMPVSYQSVLKEHAAVREHCGLFDVSHMGEIFVRGDDAESFLQFLTINDVTRLADGQGQYTAICNEQGGMLDDLFVYRLHPGEYLICANASNIEKDFQWLQDHANDFKNLKLDNKSDRWSQIAIQGPNAEQALGMVLSGSDQAMIADMKFTDIRQGQFQSTPVWIARTGYTGERGFEVYLPNRIAVDLWDALLATAEKTQIVPVGLGARDTLRLESCFLLYGNDMNDTVTPIEAGIGWAVRANAGAFIGRDALVEQKEKGAPRQMIAFVMKDGGIPRTGMKIFVGEDEAGEVTSGSVLPSVGGAGGMALIRKGLVKTGDEFSVDVRGKRKVARVTQKPLYKPNFRD